MTAPAYVDTPHGVVHVRTAGPLRAATVVLLHQTPSSSLMFEALATRLAARGLRVIMPDTPGFGGSPAPVEAPSVEGWTAAIDGALARLGVVDAVVLGHHTGAAIAVELAASNPARVRRLVLVGAPCLAPIQRNALAQTPPIELAGDGHHLRALWQRLRGRDALAPASVIDRELVLAASSLAQWPQAYRAVAEYRFAARLAACRARVTIVAGEHDSLRDGSIAAAQVRRDARLLELAGAGPYACDTHADTLASIVAEAA